MTKEFEPEDPMELVGVELQGDTSDALDTFVQEYLLMGWDATQIMFLFRSSYYAATHQIYKTLGEVIVKERVQQLADQWRRGWINGGDPGA